MKELEKLFLKNICTELKGRYSCLNELEKHCAYNDLMADSSIEDQCKYCVFSEGTKQSGYNELEYTYCNRCADLSII